MDLLEPFKLHIGNKTVESFVNFESALNDIQKVRVFRLAIFYVPTSPTCC